MLRTGYTLIELMLVMAIIALVAMIAMPRYGRSLTRYRADLAAGRVAADLNFARTRANVSSAAVTVNMLVSPTNELTIPSITSMETASSTYRTKLGADPYQATLTSANFAGNPTITFNGYGKPSSGGTVVVTVGSQTRTIAVDADTGEAKVQ